MQCANFDLSGRIRRFVFWAITLASNICLPVGAIVFTVFTVYKAEEWREQQGDDYSESTPGEMDDGGTDDEATSEDVLMESIYDIAFVCIVVIVISSINGIYTAISVSRKVSTPLKSNHDEIKSLIHNLRRPISDMGRRIEMMRPQHDKAKPQLDELAYLVDAFLCIYDENARILLDREGLIPISDFEKLDIASLLIETAETVRIGAENKGLEFACKIDPQSIMVTSYRQSLRKILFNIMENATKYTNEGSIHVSLTKHGGNVVFRVVDTGRGIDAEDIKKLGKGFFRAANAKSESGFGYGMYAIDGALELFGGSRKVESPDHKGTIFTVTLPLDMSKRVREKASLRERLKASLDE